MKTKETKRLEAQERNAYYQSLSTLEKLEHIAGRPGACKRQREWLEYQLEVATAVESDLD